MILIYIFTYIPATNHLFLLSDEAIPQEIAINPSKFMRGMGIPHEFTGNTHPRVEEFESG